MLSSNHFHDNFSYSYNNNNNIGNSSTSSTSSFGCGSTFLPGCCLVNSCGGGVNSNNMNNTFVGIPLASIFYLCLFWIVLVLVVILFLFGYCNLHFMVRKRDFGFHNLN